MFLYDEDINEVAMQLYKILKKEMCGVAVVTPSICEHAFLS